MTTELTPGVRRRWAKLLGTFCVVTVLLYGTVFMLPEWRTPTPDLAAITPLPKGLKVVFDHTEEAPFWNDRILVIRDEAGRDSQEVTRVLRAHLSERGWEMGPNTAGGPLPDDYCVGFDTVAEFVAERLDGGEYAALFAEKSIPGDAVLLSMGAGC